MRYYRGLIARPFAIELGNEQVCEESSAPIPLTRDARKQVDAQRASVNTVFHKHCSFGCSLVFLLYESEKMAENSEGRKLHIRANYLVFIH